ncbi:hypothetical protein ACFWAD_29685 [Rhodococcus sp. NPDC059969]|uniref:hypothetical protein n=1 Tax=Rhodococcus sp. NPDC059969 TaxID=3347018 RepID=UPI003671D72A
MTEPTILTIHYTPPGAAPGESLRLQLPVQPGAPFTFQLGAPDSSPPPAQDAAPSDHLPAPAIEPAAGQPTPGWKEQTLLLVQSADPQVWLSTSTIRGQLETAGTTVSRSTLSMELSDMARRGVLRQRGTGPHTEYSAPQHPPAPPAPRASDDWEKLNLPPQCAPHMAPALLTEEQAQARIAYGLALGWTQRRIAQFAGKSAATVNKANKKQK